ncbi:MAG: 30S ribosomal protein S6 [Alphaproteobacteria bacterium]|nr:MAG: 30S ribosomal protein S6 [Alphaproteobacteria bacterium]
MPLYEHIFIARQDISPAQVEGLTETLQKIVTDNGGKIEKSEYWGLRSLQYKIKKNRKGHYALLNIKAPHEAVAEMERLMKLNDDIIRFMTVRVEEHEEGPSAVLQSRGRDDRRPRREDGPRRDDGPRGGSRSERPSEAPKSDSEA